MKRIFFLLPVFVCFSLTGKTVSPDLHKSAVNIMPTSCVYLYPEGQNVDKGVALGPGESNGFESPWEEYSFRQYTRIADPYIDLYVPEKCNGQMVIICPGGGYKNVCANHEGMQVAMWLNKRGIAAGVLIYRTPNGHHNIPLTDVQNAFRYCRVSRYQRTFVNLILGEGAPKENIDKEEYAPLLKRYSLDEQVTKDTPPTIIFFSWNDRLPIANSLIYYQSLVDHGVCCEIHSLSSGKHGWGFGTREGKPDPLTPVQRAELENILNRWLVDRAGEIKNELVSHDNNSPNHIINNTKTNNQ